MTDTIRWKKVHNNSNTDIIGHSDISHVNELTIEIKKSKNENM